jgi:hypothetical protein
MAGTNLRRRERKLDIPPWIAEKYRSGNAPYPLVARYLAIEGNLDIRPRIAEYNRSAHICACMYRYLRLQKEIRIIRLGWRKSAGRHIL